jgi:hypothetical protein
MPSARTNPRELATLLAVVRAIVDDIAREGGPVGPAQVEVLTAVQSFLDGEKVAKKETARLQKAVSAAARSHGVASPPREKAVYWITGSLSRLLTMVETGRSEMAEALTQAGYAIGSLRGWDHARYTAHVEELQQRAAAGLAELSPEPYAEKPKRVNAKVAAAERAALSSAREALSPAGRALLDRIGAARDLGQQGTRAKLAASLKRHRYPRHDAVERFEEQFGGLLIPVPGADDWRAQNQYALVGAYGCLRAGGDLAPRRGEDWEERGFVPVAYTARDAIAYLDQRGHGYLQGTIEGGAPGLLAGDAASLVAGLIALELAFHGGPLCAGAAPSSQPTAKAAAEALELPLLCEGAPDGTWRIWASAEAIVVELPGASQLAAFSEAAWARLAPFAS